MRGRNAEFLVCLAVLVLLAGCGADVGEGPSPSTPSIDVTEGRGSPTPGVDASAGPASPTPAAVLTSPLESPLLPTSAPPSSCLALIEPVGNTVCGRIISQIDGKPVAGRPVYLAEALFSDDGSSVFAALDQESAPQGNTDENGMFYVTDVPPNMYFLMIGEFPQPIMLKEPDNPANDLYLDWREEGGVVDLGIIPAAIASLQEP